MNTLTRNVGPLDRTLRIAAGIALLAVAGPDRVWAYLGIVPLATGVAGRCPFYVLFGVDTARRWRRRPRAP